MRRSLSVSATASLLVTAPAFVVLGSGTAHAAPALHVQTTAPAVLGIAGESTPITVKASASGGQATAELGVKLTGVDLGAALGGLNSDTVQLSWQDGNTWRRLDVAPAGSDAVTATLPKRALGPDAQTLSLRLRVAPKQVKGKTATFDPSAPKPKDPANPYGRIVLTTTLRPVDLPGTEAATDQDDVRLGAPTIALVGLPGTYTPGGPPKEFRVKVDNPTDSEYRDMMAVFGFELAGGNDKSLLTMEYGTDSGKWRAVVARDVAGGCGMSNTLPKFLELAPHAGTEERLRMTVAAAAKPGAGVMSAALDVSPGPDGAIAEFCGEHGPLTIAAEGGTPTTTPPATTPAPGGGATPADSGASTPDAGPRLAETGSDSGTGGYMVAGAAALAAAGAGAVFAVRRRRA
ncbi:LAETG motif-containing sortase-dependent surface protein [Yinghuangia seranimata]|uniref:LAETG motif-containing sortase-dependent surface protein n=1 Tax=Yinghuangia seranimata TaxID=408067 RepID=UPI00248CC5EA|nr:LAETG motif-containing sortase-dependent surface protein [Yinghuangia seranimata]MDI2129234.1 LAETG motif-containing sortase-dependent surface protein [Yinghuangia seranimata]